MTSFVTILLIDKNRFFAEGLGLGITQYFGDNNINVTYTENLSYESDADIVFLAMDLGGEKYNFYKLSHSSKQCVFLIKGRKQTQRNCPSFSKISTGTISREQSLASVLALIELALLKYDNKKHAFPDKDDDVNPQPVLTYREYEIMRHLFFGMNNHAISHQLNISEKTVSSHKRAAMRKLNLTQNIELNYWLLNGGLNAVKVFNSYQPNSTLHVMH